MSNEITYLLENLNQLLRHQVSLIASTKNELELLKKDLDLLKAFLRDAAKIRRKSERLRDAEKRVKDGVHDVENTIYFWKIRAVNASKRNVISRHLMRSFNLAKEVKSLRERQVIMMVGEVAAIDMRFEESEHESSPKPIEFQIVKERNVVGFEDAVGTIIGYLQEPTEKMDVISIIGLPGLGKTTLARKIMKSEYVKREFPNRIWVHVTHIPNIRNVILTILMELTGKHMSGLCDHILIETVQQYLKERKIFLVLDDVWTKSAWNDISMIFSESNKKSKVLLTSRVRSVGAIASEQRNPYNMPFLTSEKSWELLQYVVFGKLGVCPEDLKVVGQRIASECHGLPLSVMVIGRILFDQWTKNHAISDTEDAWVKVSNNVSKYLKKKQG